MPRDDGEVATLALFGSKQQANLRSTAKMVEEVIAELGLSPQENRLQTESGNPAWGLMKGSAQVFVFINPGTGDENLNSLQVVAPVIIMPEAPGSQMALFRHVLELNAREITGAAFGIKGDTVVITVDRSTVDLDRSEVKDMVLRVGYYADLYDDTLVSQFGGRRHAD
jgi:hypothetical protein